jgi:hypothetical protein
MAARRDRERRRPSGESRYRFGTPESAVEAEDSVTSANGGDATQAASTPANRQSRSSARGTRPDPPRAAAVSTRGGARPAALPFSAYAAEYAYVGRDLRRVGLVIGSLLVILILLYFVLPH